MLDRAGLVNWALLGVLILLWGSSFLFTAISVDTIDPISVVFYRLVLGALVLSLVVDVCVYLAAWRRVRVG